MKRWIKDERRFRELVLYVSDKYNASPVFGATKLNKVLFFADFYAYTHLGYPITGFDYQRLPNGPAPRGMVTLRASMQEAGEIRLKEVPLQGGKVQHRIVALRRPDLSVFTKEQLDVIDHIIDELRNHDAESVSDLSHVQVGWKAARPGEIIPYGSAYLSDDPLSPDEISGVQRFAEANGYARS